MQCRHSFTADVCQTKNQRIISIEKNLANLNEAFERDCSCQQIGFIHGIFCIINA